MTLRVVLDTSSLVSYALTKGVIMSQVVDAWAVDDFIVLFSPQTRTELFIVLDRPYIHNRAGAARSWLEEHIEQYAHNSHDMLQTIQTTHCLDPDTSAKVNQAILTTRL